MSVCVRVVVVVLVFFERGKSDQEASWVSSGAEPLFYCHL